MIAIVDYRDRGAKLGAVLSRRAAFSPDVDAAVRGIIEAVQARGDEAVRTFTERFDGVRLEALAVPAERLAEAAAAMDPALQAIIAEAAANIRRFHEAKQARAKKVSTGAVSTIRPWCITAMRSQ